jgi:hypothetical protein
MDWIYDDGGSGSGDLRDCVTRSIAIAAQVDYDEVYERVAEITSNVIYEDGSTFAEKHGYYEDDGMAEVGVPTEADEKIGDYLAELGFTWHRCGLGDDPLPTTGRLIVEMPGHYTTIIDGLVHDTWDCRGQPVEGYWALAEGASRSRARR